MRLRETIDTLGEITTVEGLVDAIRQHEALECRPGVSAAKTRQALSRFVSLCDLLQLEQWDQLPCRLMRETLRLLTQKSPEELPSHAETREALSHVAVHVDGLEELRSGPIEPQQHAASAYSLRSLRQISPNSYFLEVRLLGPPCSA